MERFLAVKDKVKQIDDLLDRYESDGDREALGEIRRISGEIIEDL